MAKIKYSDDSKCWWGCGERGTLLHCWWDCKLVQPLWKSVWRFLRKLNIILPEDPAIPLLGIYPKDAPTYNKDTCSTMFIAALFIIVRSWKEPRCPLREEWIQRNVVHLHNGVLLSYQKQWLHEIHRQMEWTRKYHPEWGYSITEKHTWYALIDKWILAKKLKLPKMQSTDHRKLRKDDQMQMLPLLLKRGKIFIWGDMEAKFRAVAPGMAIQSLTHMWTIYIQPPKLDKIDEAKICMHKGTGYSSLLRDTSRACPIQRSILATNHWTENRTPLGGISGSIERVERACNPIKTTMPTNQSFQGLNHYWKTIHGLTQGSNCICSRK